MIWNGAITVTQADDDQSLQSIPLHDFLYFELDQKRILGHTEDSVYRLPWTSMKVLTNLLLASSDLFERVDKASILNLHRVTRLNSEFGIAYFDLPDGGCKRCFVAGTNLRGLRAKLEKLRGPSAEG